MNKIKRYDCIIIDFSHMSNRNVSGIERVSSTLFGEANFNGRRVQYVEGGSLWKMVFQQWVGIPLLMMFNRKAQLICPGFPPSPVVTLFFRNRTYIYIYDLFLLRRKSDLNWRAKFYMRPSFIFALRHGRRFLALSKTVADQLYEYVNKNAVILPCRPKVENVFGLSGSRHNRDLDKTTIKVLSIGTVEPRKNFLTSAEICRRLAHLLNRPVEFHIIGRRGWGDDYEILQSFDWVTLHGFQNDMEMRNHISTAHFFLYTPYDEGLGLPAVEVQYGGLPVVASDIPIFREVLGESAIYISSSDESEAAWQISNEIKSECGRLKKCNWSEENVYRWNKLADSDWQTFSKYLDGADS